MHLSVALVLFAQATRFAPVLTAAPERPHLDLGPVLVREGERPKSEAAIARELDVTAQELGADGFVYEKRGLEEIYLVGVDSPGKVVAFNLAAIVLLAATGARGAVGLPLKEQPMSTSKVAYYRAIRYVTDPPIAVDISSSELPRELALALAKAPNLSAQLLLAHRALAAGELPPAAYRELRRRLARS